MGQRRGDEATVAAGGSVSDPPTVDDDDLQIWIPPGRLVGSPQTGESGPDHKQVRRDRAVEGRAGTRASRSIQPVGLMNRISEGCTRGRGARRTVKHGAPTLGRR